MTREEDRATLLEGAPIRRRNREDIDRQVAMLAKAYRDAGVSAEVALHAESGGHYRLTIGGYAVTDWRRKTRTDVWEALLDMRRAVTAVTTIRSHEEGV